MRADFKGAFRGAWVIPSRPFTRSRPVLGHLVCGLAKACGPFPHTLLFPARLQTSDFRNESIVRSFGTSDSLVMLVSLTTAVV
jgi:hypothetical protein